MVTIVSTRSFENIRPDVVSNEQESESVSEASPRPFDSGAANFQARIAVNHPQRRI